MIETIAIVAICLGAVFVLTLLALKCYDIRRQSSSQSVAETDVIVADTDNVRIIISDEDTQRQPSSQSVAETGVIVADTDKISDEDTQRQPSFQNVAETDAVVADTDIVNVEISDEDTQISVHADENKKPSDGNTKLAEVNNSLSDEKKSLTDLNKAPSDGNKVFAEAHNTLSNKNKELESTNTELMSSVERLKRELRKKDEEITKLSCTKTNMQLKEKEDMNMNLTTALEDMSQRLAEEMNKKLSSDESTFENIDAPVRPMTVADEYSLLFSNAWLNAKITLDDNVRLENNKSDEHRYVASREGHAEKYDNESEVIVNQTNHTTQSDANNESFSELLELAEGKTNSEKRECESYQSGENKGVSDNESNCMEADGSPGKEVQVGGTNTDVTYTSASCGVMALSVGHKLERKEHKSASESKNKADKTAADVDVSELSDNYIYVSGSNEEELEKWKHNFLLIILMTSWTKSSELYKQRAKQLLFVARHPADTMNTQEEVNEIVNTHSNTLISDLLRYNSKTANLDNLEKTIVAECSRWPHYDKCMSYGNIRDYLQKCTRIAWKMVIQRPSMMLVVDQVGKSWSQCEGLEPIWNSMPSNPNATVKYYKNPQLYHANRCMAKGSVYVA